MTEEVVDCECHPLVAALEDLFPYMEPAWAERFRRTGFVLPTGWPHPGRETGLSGFDEPPRPEQAAAALGPEVRRAILVPSQVMPCAGWCDHALSAVYAAAVNDYVRDAWLSVDDRFRLAVAVAPHDPDAAAAEIRRHADHEGVVAVATSLLAVNLGHRHYEPILAAAHEHRLPLIVHPGGSEGVALGAPTLGGVGPRDVEERYALLPQVAQANLASVIYDGVFSRFPELRLVFAGFGFEWAVPLLWRADMEWRNLRLDVPWVTEPPSVLAARHIRLVVDDLGAAPPADVAAIADMLPDGLLLYGSDRPFAAGGADGVLRGLPERLHDAVAHGNADATFGARLGA